VLLDLVLRFAWENLLLFGFLVLPLLVPVPRPALALDPLELEEPIPIPLALSTPKPEKLHDDVWVPLLVPFPALPVPLLFELLPDEEVDLAPLELPPLLVLVPRALPLLPGRLLFFVPADDDEKLLVLVLLLRAPALCGRTLPTPGLADVLRDVEVEPRVGVAPDPTVLPTVL